MISKPTQYLRERISEINDIIDTNPPYEDLIALKHLKNHYVYSVWVLENDEKNPNHTIKNKTAEEIVSRYKKTLKNKNHEIKQLEKQLNNLKSQLTN